MKRIFTLLIVLAAFIHLQAQDHTIAVSNNIFTPSSLTVQVGETVQWTNMQGFHNVNGSTDIYTNNPEGFSNGAASNDAWTFEYTFTLAGTYTYQCDPHAGVGMIGSITVEGGANNTSDVVITEIMYNSPNSTDLEFLELYNNTNATIDLTDWSFSSGFEFVFPASTLGAGEYVVISSDALLMLNVFGVTAMEWTGGGLSNGGEAIVLVDAAMAIVDSLKYDDGNGWPNIADGNGPSLVLCDANSDNTDPVNWQRAITSSNYNENCRDVFANPGTGAICTMNPIVTFEISCLEVSENIGEIEVEVLIDNPRAIDTAIEITVDGTSTATNTEDFNLSPLTIIFPAGTDTAQTFTLQIIDDVTMNEGDETIVLSLESAGDAIITGTTLQTITIGDNDIELTNALRLTGVFDGTLSGGFPKGIEIFAAQDITDLSIFGVGSANNGGGTDGEEFSFPAVAVTAGTFIYVTNDSAGFNDFFGFYSDMVYVEGSAANINGDDAVELFENSQIIDVFGEINVDGTGEAWEYLDSWAYRKSATGPDGNIFVLDNWVFGGIDVFDDHMTNETATSPFPTGTYMLELGDLIIAEDDNAETDLNMAVTISVLNNDALPNAVISLEIIQNGNIGTAIVNSDNTVTYTPNMDECGDDSITYEVCDANGCDQASVTIAVTCPVTYPIADIASVTGIDTDGVATSLDQTFELQGVVHGNDFRSGTGVQCTMIDATGGIAVFNFDIDYYEAVEGDEIIARGSIGQFNGLTQMNPDTIIFLSSANALTNAITVTTLNEDTESEMIRIENLSLVDASEWTNDGSGFNVNVTDGTNTYLMRIDADTDIFGTTAPNFGFHLTGIGSQFDNDGLPLTDGYQIYPRYLTDIEMVTAVDEPFVDGAMSVFPNPVSGVLNLKTDLDIDRIEVLNVLGQQVMNRTFSSTLDWSHLTTGVYYLTLVQDGNRWTTKVVKR